MAPSALRFAGYAAVFDRVDRGGDVIRRGAFRRSIGRGGAVPLLREHRRGAAVGVVESIAEDANGLRVIARVSDAATARAVREGLGGLSVGYRVREARSLDRPGGAGRELIALELIEVSLVARPMQPLAGIYRLGVW